MIAENEKVQLVFLAQTILQIVQNFNIVREVFVMLPITTPWRASYWVLLWHDSSASDNFFLGMDTLEAIRSNTVFFQQTCSRFFESPFLRGTMIGLFFVLHFRHEPSSVLKSTVLKSTRPLPVLQATMAHRLSKIQSHCIRNHYLLRVD